jgi:Tol biopolymer transport system component
MKLLKVTMWFITAALVFAQGEGALQKAIRKETLEGDLKGAIESYKKLAQDKDRAIAAKALVRMGECYEKLGDSEARKAYERVVREFADQKDAAAAANTRLGAISKPAISPGPVTRVVASDSPGRSSSAISYPVDVSPDGRYLLQRNGSEGLRLKELRTGQIRPLAKDLTGGRFSQDGSRIASLRWVDRVPEVWIVASDGSGSRKIWQGEKSWRWFFLNSWFPDNQRFLAEISLDDRNKRLIAISAIDGSSTTLWEGARPEGYGMLSPDGKYVVFSKVISREPLKSEVHLLSLADLSESTLLAEPGVRAAWTADGTGLVYLSDRRKPGSPDLWYLAVANGKAQGRPELVKADFGDKPMFGTITRDGALHYTDTTDMRDVLTVEIDPTTGKAIGSPVAISGQGVGPAGGCIYSPDGRWMAYRRDTPQTFHVLRNLETGEERQFSLGFARVTDLGWFPDSRSLLVYGRRSANDPLGLYRVNVESAAATLVKPNSFDAPFDISPDGKTIYYSRHEPGEEQTSIMALEIETGKERKVMRGNGLSGGKGWIALAISPDGKQLAAALDGHGIEIQPVAGGSSREVYRIQNLDGTHEMRWSPDGRYIVFQTRNGDGEGLWRVAVTGGTAQEMGITANAIGKVSIHPDGRHITYVGNQSVSQVMALENFLPKTKASK